MRTGYFFFAFFSACLLASCAASSEKNARTFTNYSGQDHGVVVVGIGAKKGTEYDGIALSFRRLGDQPNPPLFSHDSSDPLRYVQGIFVYFQNNIFAKEEPDYKSDEEAGILHVATLPPGQYELFKVGAHLGGGGFFSKDPFSIPFTVNAGEVTYLGNFQANRTPIRRFLGLPGYGGPYFVVADRMTSELELAEKKSALKFHAVSNATPDVDNLRIGFFVRGQLSD